MQQQLEREKRQAIKTFKVREKQLETVVMITMTYLLLIGWLCGIIKPEFRTSGYLAIM